MTPRQQTVAWLDRECVKLWARMFYNLRNDRAHPRPGKRVHTWKEAQDLAKKRVYGSFKGRAL